MESVEPKHTASVQFGDGLTRRRFLAAAGGTVVCAAVPLTGLALPATVLSSEDSSGSAQPALIRRNVTRLSAAEKAEWVKVILEMKKVRSPFAPSVSYYDQFARWHLLSRSCSRQEHPDTPWPAHASPGFLPWHRLLVLLFERGMYAVTGKRIAVPYWDWTQSGAVDAVFTEDFIGPRRGDPKQNYVMTNGPFRKDAFALNVPAPSEDPGQSRHLVRAYGVYANDYHKNLASSLPTAQELAEAMALEVYDVAPFASVSSRTKPNPKIVGGTPR